MAIAERDVIDELINHFGKQNAGLEQTEQAPVELDQREKKRAREAEFLKLREEEAQFLAENPWLLETAREVGEVIKAQGQKVLVDSTKPAGEERPAGITIIWGEPNAGGSVWIANRLYCPVERDEQGAICGVRIGKSVMPTFVDESARDHVRELMGEEILRIAQERLQLRKVTTSGK